MELDSFLSSPRWDILRIIIDKPSSPIEISQKLKTTTSFISQQLKLLEVAGLVKKERTGAVEKGKPRSLFSISKESLYLVPLSKDLKEKKLIPLSKDKKIIIKIWCLGEEPLQSNVEKFFWKIQEFLDDIEAIFIYTKKSTVKIYLLSKDSSLTHKINEKQKKSGKDISFQVTPSAEFLAKLDLDHIFSLYDPQKFLEENKVLKGGIEKNE